MAGLALHPSGESAYRRPVTLGDSCLWEDNPSKVFNRRIVAKYLTATLRTTIGHYNGIKMGMLMWVVLV